MSASRSEIVVFGYMREFCASINKELPTTHIINLFVKWISLMDKWDKDKSHETIKFETEWLALCPESPVYGTCVGEYIIQKGMKQSWTFKTNSSTILAGVVDNKMVETHRNIEDFTSTKYKGYGVMLMDWVKYHATDHFGGDGHFEHAAQFLWHSKERVITMELDLTQKEHKKGILRFIIHSANIKEGIRDIRKDGEFTQIVYHDIDINEKYRAAFDIGETDASIQLIEEPGLMDL